MNRSKFAFTPACLGMACLLSIAAVCGAQIFTPVMGVARLGDGTLRILYGVPDNVIVDSRSLGRYEAASFSDEAGLVYTQGTIQLLDKQLHLVGEYNSAGANAILNIDGGPDTAIAWLPGSKELLRWDGKAFQVTSVHGLPEAFKVSSLRRDGSNAELLIYDSNGPVFQVSVSIGTGELASMAPVQGVRAPAFWAGNRILFGDPNGLAVQEPNGTIEAVAALGGELSFERMSSQRLLVTSATAQRSWVVDRSTGQLHISEIPATPATTEEGVR